jgi:two-component system chemotaxis response regulator CheV
MKKVGNILLEKEILLESGTNEVEVLVFRVGAYRLGVNVAKVREVLASQKITQLPQSHPSVLGCFRLRDAVVPCVSLHMHLHQESPDKQDCQVILAEFNRCQTAFLVDEVERIHRISWEQILPAPPIVTSVASPVTAVTNIEGNLVMMLDFEMIAAEISSEEKDSPIIEELPGVDRGSRHILMADDSSTVRNSLRETLISNGYANVTSFENGSQVWDFIKKRFDETGDVRQVADILISDVEMPAMDGLHLTRNIKEHPQLRSLPVVLFSSILTVENRRKGAAVGADVQITKYDIAEVVTLLDDIILKRSTADAGKVSASSPVPALQPCG